MTTNVMTVIIYVVLVLAVVGGIGAVAYFTSGFTSDFQTFYLRYEGENILESTNDMVFVDDSVYLFEVKYTFGAVAKEKTGYSVKVVPCIKDNDFTYLVDGEEHRFSELSDLTSCFDIQYSNDSFTIAGNAQVLNVLQRYHDGATVEFVNTLAEMRDYFTMVVYSYNNKAAVKVSFHGIDVGGNFRIEPDPVVF